MDHKEKGKEYYKYGERGGGRGERTTRKEQKRELQERNRKENDKIIFQKRFKKNIKRVKGYRIYNITKKNR